MLFSCLLLARVCLGIVLKPQSLKFCLIHLNLCLLGVAGERTAAASAVQPTEWLQKVIELPPYDRYMLYTSNLQDCYIAGAYVYVYTCKRAQGTHALKKHMHTGTVACFRTHHYWLCIVLCRGCHLITRNIYNALPELSEFEVVSDLIWQRLTMAVQDSKDCLYNVSQKLCTCTLFLYSPTLPCL